MTLNTFALVDYCELKFFSFPQQLSIFPNLKTLSLDNNKLESIETLTQVSLPSLNILLLFNNKIQNIKQLRKLHFSSSLQELSLSMNPVIDSLMAFQHINLKELKELRIYDCKINEIGSITKISCEEVKEVGFDFFNEGIMSRLKKLRFKDAK